MGRSNEQDYRYLQKENGKLRRKLGKIQKFVRGICLIASPSIYTSESSFESTFHNSRQKRITQNDTNQSGLFKCSKCQRIFKSIDQFTTHKRQCNYRKPKLTSTKIQKTRSSSSYGYDFTSINESSRDFSSDELISTTTNSLDSYATANSISERGVVSSTRVQHNRFSFDSIGESEKSFYQTASTISLDSTEIR